MKFTRSALLFLCAFGVTLVAFGAEITGTIRKVDPNKDTVVIRVDGKDVAYKVSSNTTYQAVSTRLNPKTKKTTETVSNISTGLEGIREGYIVTVTTNEDGKITLMKVTGQEKTVKKK